MLRKRKKEKRKIRFKYADKSGGWHKKKIGSKRSYSVRTLRSHFGSSATVSAPPIDHSRWASAVRGISRNTCVNPTTHFATIPVPEID